MKTVLLTSELFVGHDTGTHPEHAERVISVVDFLRERGDSLGSVGWLETRAAELADVMRCHDEKHIGQVIEACELAESRQSRVALDPDTVVSGGSLAAALHACGAALAAVDAVMRGVTTNGFVAVRPPGHHATPDRAMGFCLFNNVAIAARYIQNVHNLERVLIVDWDVHHGNGTQDVFYEDPSVFFYSVHQFPHYPGTGSRYEEGAGAGKGFTLNVPLRGGTSAADHVAAFREGLKKTVEKLQPDFILVSAGFDGHISDPLGDLNLTDDDYRAMTRDLMNLAADHCEGRLVSLLEGGYNLDTLPGTVAAHVETLANSSLTVREGCP
jgi:acetoin utilization deacetylase AcuC-like enzyme